MSMSGSNKTIQQRNSQKSAFRTISGARDQGQRYLVRYSDGMGTRRTYGYANDQATAEQYVAALTRNPMFSKPKIIDRQKGPGT